MQGSMEGSMEGSFECLIECSIEVSVEGLKGIATIQPSSTVQDNLAEICSRSIFFFILL